MNVKSILSVSASSLLALGLACGLTPNASALESATGSSQSISIEDTAYNQFYAQVKSKADTGDLEAKSDLSKLNALSASQKSELGGYLSGTKEFPKNTTGNVVITRQESNNLLLDNGGRYMSPNASVTKSVWATEAFTFAGVKISETKVSGSYVVNNGRITGILGHSCYVTRSYDPMQAVSSDRSSSYISGGRAVFECRVSSSYGIPGYGGLSKREAIQYLTAGAAGNVVARGWR